MNAHDLILIGTNTAKTNRATPPGIWGKGDDALYKREGTITLSVRLSFELTSSVIQWQHGVEEIIPSTYTS